MKEAEPMTEPEWQTGVEFRELYRFAIKTKRCSQRLKYLLGVAVCRRIDALYPDPLCREAIDLVERIADGQASPNELPALRSRLGALRAAMPTITLTEGDWEGMPGVDIIPTEALGVVRWLVDEDTDQLFGRTEDVCGLVAARQAGVMPTHAPYEAIDSFWYSKEFKAGRTAEENVTCALLRDVFGNPFRKGKWNTRWRTATVGALAEQIYETRDFTTMPILADALEETGCTERFLLDHLRGPGPHCRGCLTLDLVSGKERRRGFA
jgi:hypothetical protein